MSKKLTSLLVVLWVLVYSSILAPLLWVSARKSPQLHGWLTRPLLFGPYKGYLLSEIEGLVLGLENGRLTDRSFIERVNSVMCSAVEAGEIDEWLMDLGSIYKSKNFLMAKCLGYVPLKRWYLKLHFMAPGHSHDLHGHNDVISTQIIVAGRMKVQEFDALDPLLPGRVRLKLLRDDVVDPVTGFYTTNDYANIHGFEPHGGPAIRFQFYLRGQSGLMARLLPKRGRLYISPDWSSLSNGEMSAFIKHVK